jgi:hypothetical protein
MEPTTPTTGRGHLHLVPRPAPQAPATPVPEGRLVASEVANALAAASDDALVAAPLALPLALSVCMQRHGVDADRLVDTMRALRVAVLRVAGMDRASEPVPVAAGDPRSAALAMADYLVGLLRRAVRESGSSPDDVASAAAALLAA